MTLLWTSAAIGSVMLVLIVMLICRERKLRRQLAEYRDIINSLAEGQNIRQDGDVERFKRSQYFARIGTWDWDVDTDKLYWSEAIYGMFGFKIGEVTPSYALFCSCVHPDDRARVRDIKRSNALTDALIV
ncbi:putative diguanylate cyclase [compost metagenome]